MSASVFGTRPHRALHTPYAIDAHGCIDPLAAERTTLHRRRARLAAGDVAARHECHRWYLVHADTALALLATHTVGGGVRRCPLSAENNINGNEMLFVNKWCY